MNKNKQNKIGLSFFIIILSLTVCYSYYQTKGYTQGPILQITEPLDGTSHHNNIINIKGHTKNISYISMNDRQIFVDEKGGLDEKLFLSPGYNIIKVKALDKYQREIERKLELIYN